MNDSSKNYLRWFRKSRSVLFVSVIPVLVMLGLMTVPLFRDIDYEFNAILGIVFFIVSIVITLKMLRSNEGKIRGHDGQIDVEIRESNLYIFKSSLIVVSFSLAASFTAAIIIAITLGSCISIRGIQFFLLLPVTSAVIGCGLGYMAVSFFSRYAGIAIAAILVLSAALNLLWVKLNVPIYVYSIFWGYFPGPIYDEWIPVTPVLWIHRLWSLLFAFLFVITALIWRSRPRVPGKYRFFFIFTLILIFGIYEMRFLIGFDAGYEDVKKSLGGTSQNKNVILIFDEELNKGEIGWIGLVAEFYHEQITSFLDLKKKRQVTVYIYKDEYQKKQLMGAGRTNFAKIFNDEIHINFEDVEGVLKHEMTHVLANDFGNPYYGTDRIGFLEGVAVACEWNESYFTPHEWATALKKQNKLPDVSLLVGPDGFFSNAAGLSYTVAGSFTRYLIDTYGVHLFKRAYYEEDIQNVYGVTTGILSDRWKVFLDSIHVADDDVKLAGVLIQPSLFQKRCPHYVADILEEANTEYGKSNYSGAGRAFQKALSIDSENYRILINLIRSRYYSGDFISARREADSLLASPKINYLSRASLMLLKGDIRLLSQSSDSALAQYKAVTADYANISSVYIAAKLRAELMYNGKAELLRNIVRTPDPEEQKKNIEKLVKEYSENKFYKFWLTRLHFQSSGYRDVAALWDSCTGAVPDTIIEFERLKMLAESALRLSEYDSSKKYWNSVKELSWREMDREYAEQRLSLLDWLALRSN